MPPISAFLERNMSPPLPEKVLGPSHFRGLGQISVLTRKRCLGLPRYLKYVRACSLLPSSAAPPGKSAYGSKSTYGLWT